MEIKNKSGDFLGKIQIESLESDHIMDHIIRDLRPGDGKAIYIADATENQFTQQTNYAAVEWEHGLDRLSETLSLWRPRFPAHVEVHTIQVYYGFDNLTPDEIDEMAEESKTSGQNVVVRDLKPNTKLVGVSIKYKEYGTFKLNIFGTTKSRIQLPDHELSQVKPLHVRGAEAFYFSNDGTDRLIWIEEGISGKALQYELIGQQILAEKLIQIADSMKVQ